MGDKLGSISTGKLQAKLNEASKKTRRILAGTLISFITYIGLGALFFSYAEGWKYVDSLYFAVATASTPQPLQNRPLLAAANAAKSLAWSLPFFSAPSFFTSPHLARAGTVGYGDLTPVKWYSKGVNMVFIFAGVAIFFTNMSSLLSNLQVMAISKMQLMFARKASGTSTAAMKEKEPSSAVVFYLRNSMGFVGMFVAFQCLLALPYAVIRLDFDEVYSNGTLVANATSFLIPYGEAIYFSWITATTCVTHARDAHSECHCAATHQHRP